MLLKNILLALSIAGSSFARHSPNVRRDDDLAPTEADKKTALEPRRFIVEFSEVSNLVLH